MGADVMLRRDQDGATPVEIAAANEQLALVDLLEGSTS
jgi:ankyrin repeat protein